MARSAVRLVVGLLLALLGERAFADVYVTPKHLLILRQGLDAVYGNYVFAVQNSGDQEERFSAKVMLPKETVDFMPQEGVDPSELTPAQGGGLMLDKSFPPGIHIISIGFKADGQYGHARLTMTPVAEIQSFTLLLPRDSGIDAQAPGLKDGDASAAPDPQYRPLVSSTPLAPDQPFVIDVSGLPEGRGRLWLVGAALAAVMALGALYLAIKTRPRLTADDSGGQILVG